MNQDRREFFAFCASTAAAATGSCIANHTSTVDDNAAPLTPFVVVPRDKPREVLVWARGQADLDGPRLSSPIRIEFAELRKGDLFELHEAHSRGRVYGCVFLAIRDAKKWVDDHHIWAKAYAAFDAAPFVSGEMIGILNLHERCRPLFDHDEWGVETKGQDEFRLFAATFWQATRKNSTPHPLISGG